MKKILLLALPLMTMCFASCEKDKWTDDSPIIQFKDPRFLEALLEIADKNGDGQISEKEASIVTYMPLYAVNGRAEIRAMDELKYFTALEVLYCWGNQLTSLDVSKNTALTGLDCSYNQLTSLDVSKNTALTGLHCSYNQLTSLDVSNNTALTYLTCFDNQLTSLDVSNNTALTYLSCFDNQLTSLDVSKCKKIDFLRCVSFSASSSEITPDLNTKCPLESLKIYKYHVIRDYCMSVLEEVYGDIIEYVD